MLKDLLYWFSFSALTVTVATEKSQKRLANTQQTKLLADVVMETDMNKHGEDKYTNNLDPNKYLKILFWQRFAGCSLHNLLWLSLLW